MNATGSEPPTPENSAGSNITFVCHECDKRITFPGERRGHVETCPYCCAYVDVPDSAPCCDASAKPSLAEDDSRMSSGAALPTTDYLWFEVAVVLCLAVVPALFGALAATARWIPRSYPFVYWQASTLIHAVQVAAPLLAILSLTKEPWSQFGIVRFSASRDIAAGAGIWVCGVIAYAAVASLLPGSAFAQTSAENAVRWAKPEGIAGGLLLLTASLANGFAEELVMRGYLLTRLELLLHSTGLSVLVTTLLFASYHIYQGAVGVAAMAVLGMIYGGAFCCQRRLWPVCIAHAIADAAGVMWS
jgi:membrane protease YdiL (CAAX protease family)